MMDEAVVAAVAAAAAAAAAAAIGTTATLMMPLIKIRYGIDGLTSVGVIRKINEAVAWHNNNNNTQMIELVLTFPRQETDVEEGEDADENYALFHFDATGEMQQKIVEASRQIQKITIWNHSNDKEEHIRCFHSFIRIVQGMIGQGKQLMYINVEEKLDPVLFTVVIHQLAEAIVQSKNNNNNAIASFHFDDCNLTPATFQAVFEALLDSGVQKITFMNDLESTNLPRSMDHENNNNNNNNSVFTGLETNISLKELDLSWYKMREEDFRNLFQSLKKNTGVEKLELNYLDFKKLPQAVQRLFEEMLCENMTLLHCQLYMGRDEQDPIFVLIQCQMELNRRWKRYMMQRERDEKTLVVITRRVEGDTNNTTTAKEEEERKKRLKMRLLFRVFHPKPVLRATLLFHLLSEYPDDLIVDTDQFQNQRE